MSAKVRLADARFTSAIDANGQQQTLSKAVSERAYVFVSYSHKDQNAVFPEMSR